MWPTGRRRCVRYDTFFCSWGLSGVGCCGGLRGPTMTCSKVVRTAVALLCLGVTGESLFCVSSEHRYLAARPCVLRRFQTDMVVVVVPQSRGASLRTPLALSYYSIASSVTRSPLCAARPPPPPPRVTCFRSLVARLVFLSVLLCCAAIYSVGRPSFALLTGSWTVTRERKVTNGKRHSRPHLTNLYAAVFRVLCFCVLCSNRLGTQALCLKATPRHIRRLALSFVVVPVTVPSFVVLLFLLSCWLWCCSC